MKKIYIFLVLSFMVIGLTACSNSNISGNQASTTSSVTKANLTLVEIAKHSSATDCWMAIDGQVYDLSQYIKDGLHPGGDKILNGCGKDASDMFHQIPKHNNGRATATLPTYLLGALQN
jgi:cytochrome b involved in lipid metabolism